MTSIPQCGSVWPSVAAVPLSRAESLWLSDQPAQPIEALPRAAEPLANKEGRTESQRLSARNAAEPGYPLPAPASCSWLFASRANTDLAKLKSIQPSATPESANTK